MVDEKSRERARRSSPTPRKYEISKESKIMTPLGSIIALIALVFGAGGTYAMMRDDISDLETAQQTATARDDARYERLADSVDELDRTVTRNTERSASQDRRLVRIEEDVKAIRSALEARRRR